MHIMDSSYFKRDEINTMRLMMGIFVRCVRGQIDSGKVENVITIQCYRAIERARKLRVSMKLSLEENRERMLPV